MIDEAVSAHLEEADDLDWKKKLPPPAEVTRSDFPKDVAAMANVGGGVIVFGVAEEQKAARGRVDVGPVDEAYERTLCSAAMTAISPPVLNLRVHVVGDPGDHAVFVVVPPSVDVPHLVYRNDYFGAPRRNNADTVWMREREIAAMYRTRFEERRASAAALLELYDEGAAGRDSTERAWLIGVARPRVLSPLRTRLTRDEARELLMLGGRRALTIAPRGRRGRHLLEFVDMTNPRAGLRRWTAPNEATSEGMRWAESWASVHDDGSVTVATAVGGQRTGDGNLPGHRVEAATLECSVADLLGLVWELSRERSSGDYEIHVGIEWGGPEPLLIQTTNQFGTTYDDGSVPLARFTPIRTTVQTDVNLAAYRNQVRDVALDVINQGGIQHVQLISGQGDERS